MKAGWRFGTILLAMGAMLAPISALAQDTTQPAATNTPCDRPARAPEFQLARHHHAAG
jgi:hypothetical protein